MENKMKTIKITTKEFNAIQPHTGLRSLKCFKLWLHDDGIQVMMEIKNIETTLEWLRDLIREMPWSVGKDVITLADKVFFLLNARITVSKGSMCEAERQNVEYEKNNQDSIVIGIIK